MNTDSMHDLALSWARTKTPNSDLISALWAMTAEICKRLEGRVQGESNGPTPKSD